ncbi:MAG: lytic murein transglycosylase, partial [Gammaproteobacteria bacterium]
MSKVFGAAAAALLAAFGPSAAAAPLDAAEVADFIAEMSARHGFDAARLETLFAQAERSDRILELMTRPAEKVKPWWEYRALFISDRRIRDGVAFWREHDAALRRAVTDYGVPADVIIAIIGVETSYGRITGNHRVLEALSTLAFHYPGGNEKRARFFRAQLEHFLLFARED